MSENEQPCECHECIVANVGKPSVTIPAYKGRPARELHGVALRQHYEALEELKAMIARMRRELGLKAPEGR